MSASEQKREAEVVTGKEPYYSPQALSFLFTLPLAAVWVDSGDADGGEFGSKFAIACIIAGLLVRWHHLQFVEGIESFRPPTFIARRGVELWLIYSEWPWPNVETAGKILVAGWYCARIFRCISWSRGRVLSWKDALW